MVYRNGSFSEGGRVSKPLSKLPIIPFNRGHTFGKELTYIQDAIQRGHLSGVGHYTRQCERFLQSTLAIPRALLTTSCTHALEMSAILLEIKPGDEVIVPTYTFVSTANAFALRGAKIVFCDSRPDTLNMDEGKLERLITPQTRAVVPVHYGGVGCEMKIIQSIAERHGIAVVEDNAHGLFGKYDGKYLGKFGSMATLSFHETKNVICGEGGALLINDPELIERAEILREKGTNRSHFFRGQVDKYTWVDIGSSYVISEILAAFLYAQLENASVIQKRRKEIWNYYAERLRAWASRNGTQLPTVPARCEQAYHLFYLLLPTMQDRDALIQHLKLEGIMSVFHYVPLHQSPMGESFGAKLGDCPVAEDIASRLLRLPFFWDLTDENLAKTLRTVTSYECRTGHRELVEVSNFRDVG